MGCGTLAVDVVSSRKLLRFYQETFVLFFQDGMVK